ncbi:fimbrial protein [Klebsiella sp. BIGb0407]|uniref:fimbrial protein n=1 Tax=Klebsiella sp. BIGb0407 TaxID=2940603 RepID=UPI002169696B|nr:fimbrial protein [Klebsiella sp. BIGb0407]MCS3430282.1 type 1 fimbria pilin [Klebsiella sp. BIGb0407]
MAKGTEKNKRLALFISVLLFSGHALSADITTPGELALSGELVAAACDIDPKSRDLWVEFGNVSARDINLNQETKLTRPFLIHLVGCQSFGSQNPSTSVAFATITFNGNVSINDSTVLMPSGEGEGFGIQIYDQRGELLTFGERSSGYLFSDKNNTLRFTASLVPIHRHIKAGEFYAVTNFFMDYN